MTEIQNAFLCTACSRPCNEQGYIAPGYSHSGSVRRASRGKLMHRECAEARAEELARVYKTHISAFLTSHRSGKVFEPISKRSLICDECNEEISGPSYRRPVWENYKEPLLQTKFGKVVHQECGRILKIKWVLSRERSEGECYNLEEFDLAIEVKCESIETFETALLQYRQKLEKLQNGRATFLSGRKHLHIVPRRFG